MTQQTLMHMNAEPRYLCNRHILYSQPWIQNSLTKILQNFPIKQRTEQLHPITKVMLLVENIEFSKKTGKPCFVHRKDCAPFVEYTSVKQSSLGWVMDL